MTIEIWLSFIVATCILCFTSGPTVAIVMGQALFHGKRSVLPLLAVVLLGDLLAMSLSFAGLGIVLSTSSSLFLVVKWLGVGFLLYLGFQAWRGEPKSLNIEQNEALNKSKVFRDAFITTALNPKGIVFFTSFFPLFIDPSSSYLSQFIVLGMSFLAVSGASVALYASFSGTISAKLTSERGQRLFNRLSGCVFLGAGVATATIKQ